MSRHAISGAMLALILACSQQPPPEEAHHSHAEEDQLSITPRGIGPYRIGKPRSAIAALPDAAPAEDGTIGFRGIVVVFEGDVACEVRLGVPGLSSAAGMEVGRPLADFAAAHGTPEEDDRLLRYPGAPWMRVGSDGGDPPLASVIVLGDCS